MDSKKVLSDTLRMLKSCETNCDNIAKSSNKKNIQKMYSDAAGNIKQACDTLQKISDKSPKGSNGEQNSGGNRNIKDIRISHHMQEISSVSVVDSDDVLRPGEIPEL